MTPFKQFAANRQNALKRTGPRTQEGKARSSRNALRHGLTAETVVEALDDARDYGSFEASIVFEHSPKCTVQRKLVVLESLLVGGEVSPLKAERTDEAASGGAGSRAANPCAIALGS